MRKFICTICGYIYDEAKGIPEAGIEAGTKWGDIPDNWVCPLCGATKADFKEVGTDSSPKKTVTAIPLPKDIKKLTALEMSILCSNLARGCEKQYKVEEATLFTELSDYFKSATAPNEDASIKSLIKLINIDLGTNFPLANAVTREVNDRGSMRALVWSEKVTRILDSLLKRYEKEGDAMLQNTGIYVCTICGFVYVGDSLPDICPVCKVPNWKFEKIEGGVL